MTAQVRPRPAWEAVDLGFMMLQRWYRPVLLSWLVITLPVFVVINYFLYTSPVWAALVFWWLLPIFDRIPLHILSRALFGEVVTAKSILKDWARILLPHFIKSLTIYRLDFARSYNLPVWQLEKLRGGARAERARVLKKMHYSSAVGLSFMCLAMEFIVFVSLFGLIMMFMPEYYAGQMAKTLFEGHNVWWVGPLLNLFLYISMLVIEPFYVAGGFSLYINRRTELEGWDIEIVFRQLAQRIKGTAKAAVLVLACMIGMQLVTLSQPSIAYAEEQQTQQNISVQSAITNEQARHTIDEIMASDEFSHKEKVAGWYLKEKPEEKKPEDKKEEEGFNWFGLNLLGNTLALAAQILIWIAVAAAVVAAVYFFIKWMPGAYGGKARRREKPLPKSLFGLEITPESLPQDVGATAQALWKAGKVIEALSLLYRAALTTLVHRDGINLRGSATEGDCLRTLAQQAEKIAQPTREFFQLLTRQWQYAAYAHRRPEEQVMQQLCQTWGEHFGGGK